MRAQNFCGTRAHPQSARAPPSCGINDAHFHSWFKRQPIESQGDREELAPFLLKGF